MPEEKNLNAAAADRALLVLAARAVRIDWAWRFTSSNRLMVIPGLIPAWMPRGSASTPCITIPIRSQRHGAQS